MKSEPELFDFAAFHGGWEWPKLSRREHAAYWQHYADRAATHPELTLERGRPSPQTAELVWSLVAPFMAAGAVKKILGRSRWGQQTELTVKQAMVITLDLFLRHARARRTISSAKLVEALAALWSPRYQMIRSQTGCRSVSAMTLEDVRGIVRELLCAGINFSVFYKIAIGYPAFVSARIPLYTVGQHIAHRGYPLAPKRKGLMAEFEEIVSGDSEYRRPGAPRVGGVLFASEETPRRSVRRRFAGSVAFDVVENGKPAEARLRALERTVLLFDVLHFKEDYRAYRRMLRASLQHEVDPKKHRQIRGRVDAVRNVRRQIQALKPDELVNGRFVEIRVGYLRSINRRYHARTFGPEWVSGHPLKKGEASPRERWFHFERPEWWVQPPPPVLTEAYRVELARFNIDPAEWLEAHTVTFDTDQLVASTPLRGYDTSSSMTQILTWLCGITELEPLVFDPKKSFTTYLAELFWSHRERLKLRAEYQTADDIRDMVKKLWVAHIYGGQIYRAVKRDPRWISDPTAVPPAKPKRGASELEWKQYRATRQQFNRKHVLPIADAVAGLLDEQPWYPKLRRFYEATRFIAHVAQERDRFAGVEWRDPYDGATIKWNPFRTASYRLTGRGWDLYLQLPGEWRKNDDDEWEFEHSERNPHGDGYLVNGQRLRQSLPPFLIHTLDACLSALVMEQFEKGRLPLVALHDAWYTVGHHKKPPVLGEFGVETPVRIAVQAAAREWDRRLGGVYELLGAYLSGTEYETWVAEIEKKWRSRPDAPTFVIAPTPKP